MEVPFTVFPLTVFNGGDLEFPLTVLDVGGCDDLAGPFCVGFGSVAMARTGLVRLRTGIMLLNDRLPRAEKRPVSIPQ